MPLLAKLFVSIGPFFFSPSRCHSNLVSLCSLPYVQMDPVAAFRALRTFFCFYCLGPGEALFASVLRGKRLSVFALCFTPFSLFTEAPGLPLLLFLFRGDGPCMLCRGELLNHCVSRAEGRNSFRCLLGICSGRVFFFCFVLFRSPVLCSPP